MSKIQGFVKLAANLVIGYKILKLVSNSDYRYNYTYLNPLAITNVPEHKSLGKLLQLPFGLPLLPKGSCPEFKWFVKVVFRLAITAVNNYLYTHTQSISPEQVGELAQELRELEIQLEASGNDFNKLEKFVNKLIIYLINIGNICKIDAELQRFYKLQPGEKITAGFYFFIEKEFQEIDNKITELILINQNPDIQGIQAPGETLDPDEASTIANLKEIIKYLAKLAELADNEDPILKCSDSSLNLDDYDKLFQIIERPAIADTFKQDEIFAYLQVAGSNPVLLQQLRSADSRLPITEKDYSSIANKFGFTDSLATALEQGRLYVADYALLDGLVNGNFISQYLEQQKYILAPVALFAVPPYGSKNRNLFPVAISYQQPSVSYQWIMFTPLNSDSNGEPWMTAKNIVQMADCNYHALISHLGRTHLFVEAFVVATNNLPNNHPLRNLLLPHLEGTVFINYGAHKLLVAPGGTVNSLSGSTIGGAQSLAAKAAQSYLFNFNHISFPETLKNRGVDDTSNLPNYPYRDDGKLLWDAIKNWVNNYFCIYYTNDSSVFQDQALQIWASTLTSLEGGRVQNFGDNGKGQITTRDYLVEAVSTIIFTASAQHAAVNYPQKDLMMYAPAFPFARYLPAPTNTQDTESFINGLPSLTQSQSQINLFYVLGSVYHTNLGNYSTLKDSKVQVALKAFKQELQKVTETINKRNDSGHRLIRYEFLLPANIPQSINS
ncbi:MAG: lipoxygenase family protein [Gloeotrichia echinulata GP01]